MYETCPGRVKFDNKVTKSSTPANFFSKKDVRAKRRKVKLSEKKFRNSTFFKLNFATCPLNLVKIDKFKKI